MYLLSATANCKNIVLGLLARILLMLFFKIKEALFPTFHA